MPSDATRKVLWLIALTGLLRIAFVAAVGLSVDESYTVAIARHFAWSYYDHPPLHVWLTGAWARLPPGERPLWLRLPDILMFAATTWLMYRLTALLYGERAGVWAVLALNLAPLFTLNAAAGVVPDGPLLLFALVAVWCFAHALPVPADGRPPAGWLLSAGAAAGLALLSKYTAVFPILALGVWLLSCRPRWLTAPAPWLAALVVVILFTPVLVWNSTHEWSSFAFQGGRALPTHLSAGRAALVFAGQLLYLLPWIGVGLLWVLVGPLRRGRADERGWLCALLAVGPIAAFSLLAFVAGVLPHWAAIGWLFAFPLLGERLDRVASLGERHARALRTAALASALLLVVLVALFALQTATGRPLALGRHDPTLDFLDWRELAPLAERSGLRQRGSVVATVSWIDAGKADYALGGAFPVLCLSRDPREYGYLHDLRAFRGRPALIVADAGRADWLALAAPYFRRIEPTPDVVLRRAGRAALTLHTAWGLDLEPPAAAAAPVAP
jgi:4-amino-4-deoxy-L-arabinose transferase-like glycosyltransferase